MSCGLPACRCGGAGRVGRAGQRVQRCPAEQNLAMGSKVIAVGLFAAWAVHDLEEIVGTRYWRRKAIPGRCPVRRGGTAEV